MGISADTASLIFKIHADSSSAEAELTKFSQKVGGIGTELAGLLGPATIAAGAITAVITGIGAAAVGVSEKLFEMSKSAAEAVKPIGGFAYVAGISVEATSALRYQLNFMGKELGDIRPGIIALEKTMDAAARGSVSAQAALARLDIKQYTNVQGALGSLFHASENFSSSVQRGGALTEVVGKRQTEVFEKLAHSVHGDFNGMIEDAKRLGVTLSDEDVAAAKEFSHEYEKVMFQAKVAAEKFALAYAGEISKAMDAVSGWLAENKDRWSEWGSSIAYTIAGLGVAFHAFEAQAQATFYLLGGWLLNNQQQAAAWSLTWRIAIASVTGGLSEIGRLTRTAGDVVGDAVKNAVGASLKAVTSVPHGPTGGGGGKGGGGRGGRGSDNSAAKQDLDASMNEQKRLLDDTEKHYKDTIANLLELFDQFGDQAALSLGVKDASKEFLDTSATYLAEYRRFEADKAGLDKETDAEKKDREQKALDRNHKVADAIYDEQKKTNSKIANADLKLANERLKIQEWLASETEKVRAETAERLIQDNLEYYQTEIDNAQGNIEEQNRLRGEAYNSTKILLDAERDKRKDDLDHEEEDQADHIRETFKNTAEALKRLEELHELYDNKRLLSAAEFQKRLDAIQKGLAIPVGDKTGSKGAFDQLLEHFKGTNNKAAVAGIEALQDAFNGLGQAIGAVVQAWILYGSAGQSVRQVTAQILAGVAQQAAIKAVFELAEGFAALALAFFGIPNAGPSAAMHFQAAAIYGGIAGVAAVAGRVVAGDSFKKETAASTSNSSSAQHQASGKGGSVYSSLGDQTIEGGNTAGNTGLFGKLIVEVRSKDSHIINVVKDNVGRRGDLRNVILSNSYG